MRLDDAGDRSNVEDRRGSAIGGAGMKLGLGGTLVVLALSFLFKTDLFALLGTDVGGPVASTGTTGPVSSPVAQERVEAELAMEKLAVATFNDAQRVWSAELPRRRATYRPARLVLFWDETRSGCGEAAAAMGPFYCPADERVYLDLGFYRELATRFGAPGQFAQAYVVAHELGHHVQFLLGIEEQVRTAQRRDPASRNALSVRMELQADCLAGIWGRSTENRRLLDPGDLEAGLGAAAAVGDDRLQTAATGRVAPERFTHGSAAQRAHWFRAGFEGGRIEDCDTFARSGP
jgi:predicted metalloprotease